MKRVILESPYAGEIAANIAYARKAVRHSLSLGEAPIASHLLYTQEGILKDSVPTEREWGIKAGLAWGQVADYRVMYMDRGLSKGMHLGLIDALFNNAEVYLRWIERKEEVSPKEIVTLLGVVNANAIAGWKVYPCRS